MTCGGDLECQADSRYEVLMCYDRARPTRATSRREAAEQACMELIP